MPLWLLPVFFVIAICYAAVGLGGGTAYIAFLSCWSVEPDFLKPTAWALNIAVAATAFCNFRAKKHFRPAKAWPYLVGGVGGAWAGAALCIQPDVFRGLLGAVLVLVSAGMMYRCARPAPDAGQTGAARILLWPLALLIGTGVGLVSGVVGIGGGLILGPIILTFRIEKPKPVAALTSLYVLLTSASALGSHVVKGGPLDFAFILPASAVVLVGAYIGSRYGAGRASPKLIRLLFSFLVFVAGLNLLARLMGIELTGASAGLAQ